MENISAKAVYPTAVTLLHRQIVEPVEILVITIDKEDVVGLVLQRIEPMPLLYIITRKGGILRLKHKAEISAHQDRITAAKTILTHEARPKKSVEISVSVTYYI